MLSEYLDTRRATISALRDWNNQQFKAEFGKNRVMDREVVTGRGYRCACEFLNEVEPAWDRLSPDEQFMLRARFIDRDEGGGIESIMKALYIGRTEAYRRSDLALNKLAKLLYW